MATEIERKFLLADNSWKSYVIRVVEMRQNYMSRNPTVRVRLTGNQGFLTVKGKSNGCSRSEFEYAIPAEDAVEMLNTLCHGYEVCKKRHIVSYAGKTWEIDVFEGVNAGLVLAEIELESEADFFEMPPWIGEEVTGKNEYYNSALAKLPWSRRP